MEKQMDIGTGNTIKRIAITGPESTGKSWLARELASHYHTVWVPEYARQYLEMYGPDYQLDDILQIAKGQLAAEKEITGSATSMLFCDTELIVIKIWIEHLYGKCPEWILEQIEHNTYDHYLLCNIDLPWQADPLREHPDLRKYFFDIFCKELTDRNLPYSIVQGFGTDRLLCAINTIEQRFNTDN
ncbi:MAG: AAA family ATPase [Bacteroidales bacterium]